MSDDIPTFPKEQMGAPEYSIEDDGGIERTHAEIEAKIEEIRNRPDTLDDSPSGRDKAYRESGEIKALRWVLGGEERAR